MADFSVASGLSLLYDEGVLPFNPAKQALASASPAEDAKLASDGFAMRRTAVALAMDDNVGHGATDLSSAAMQFLEQDFVTQAPADPKTQSDETAPQQSSYPYAGWSNNSGWSNSMPSHASTPVVATAAVASTPINVLA